MAIAYVQHNDFQSGGSSDNISNPALNTTTGNFIVVVVGSWDGTAGDAVVTDVQDTAGNTYVKAVGEYRNDGNNTERAEIWYAEDITGNANNITTVNFTGITTHYLAVIEASGVATSSSLDQTNFNSETNQTTHNAGGITTTEDNELLIGIHNSASLENWTATTNWNDLTSDVTSEYEYGEYRIVTSTDTYDIAATTGTTASTINCIAAFKGVGVTNINPKFKASGSFATKVTKVKASGSFAEKPVLVKVGGAFQ